jgi:exopolysaccharide biosynthesis polyprenyl glycosylphosphotransferase
MQLRPVPTKVVSSSIGRTLGPRAWGRLRFLVDVVVLYLASSAALFADGSVTRDATNHILAAGFPLLVIGILYARRGPDERLYGSLLDTATHVLGVISLAAMLTIALDSLLGAAHPLGLALRLWLFSLVYLGVARTVLLSVRRQAIRTDAFATPTLIVGAGLVGEHLVRRLVSEPRYGLRPVGFLDSDPLPRPDQDQSSFVPVLGGPEALLDAVEQTGARQVILAFSSEPDHVLVDTVNQCQALGVEVALVPRLYESINERSSLDHIGGLPLLTLRPTDPRGWQFAVKHTIDRTFAAVMLFALSPLMAAMAIAVRLSSPGEVFFRQKRVGRDGHEFTMLKFRTMRGSPKADGEADAGWAAQIGHASNGNGGSPMNSRITGIGRLLRASSLDELPQLINVLRGDMSLVGPRPERVSYVRDFGRVVERYHDRHRVKSGLTGWAQVNGFRGQTSIVDRVEWDNWYIQNWSLSLDLRIVAMTIAEVLRFRG